MANEKFESLFHFPLLFFFFASSSPNPTQPNRTMKFLFDSFVRPCDLLQSKQYIWSFSWLWLWLWLWWWSLSIYISQLHNVFFLYSFSRSMCEMVLHFSLFFFSFYTFTPISCHFFELKKKNSRQTNKI